MTAMVDCPACQHGDHANHDGEIRGGIDGLIGSGAQCNCDGTCAERHAEDMRKLSEAIMHPPRTPYVFLTWRDALKDAQGGIARAVEHRARVFRHAADSGLSRRQIGETVGLSAAAVQKIIGKDAKANLDDRVGGG